MKSGFTQGQRKCVHRPPKVPGAINHDSGQYRGQRHIAGGRSAIRRVLYMAALSASQHNPILGAIYQRHRQNGKPHKVALIALMRKLIVLLNRLLRNPDFVLVG
jgi:transposase